MKAFIGWIIILSVLCYTFYKLAEILNDVFSDFDVIITTFTDRHGIKEDITLSEIFMAIALLLLIAIIVFVVISIIKLGIFLIIS